MYNMKRERVEKMFDTYKNVLVPHSLGLRVYHKV